MTMDERRAIIRELERKRRENLLFRNQNLEDLGKSLVERLDEGDFAGNEGSEYRRFRREIDDSERSIQNIRDALGRIKELDEELSVKAEERGGREEELALLHTRLGEQILAAAVNPADSPGPVPAFLGPLCRQYALLRDRNDGLADRLRELESGGPGTSPAGSAGLFRV